MAAMSSLKFRVMSATHNFLYRATRGVIGGKLGGIEILLLTTVGRKSGKPRTAPLLFGRDGDHLVLVASKGGAPAHPLWYENLKANPDVEVQVGGAKRKMRARDAAGEERARLWTLMASKWKDYDKYQTLTTREIPVVVLEDRPA
jgi:deazaflavin-dependent oxidoreductase (nitroreductase family)